MSQFNKRVRVRESFLAQIWKRQLIRKDVLLTSGERALIVYPGRENNDSGPDFCDALIAIDGGRQVKGDVELHVYAGEWQAHGHHRDPGYNGVILHVVMWDDSKEACLLSSGEAVPILVLYPYLTGSIEDLCHAVQLPLLSDEPCHQSLERLGKEAVADLLDRAGEERFHHKAEQFKAELTTKEAGQVLYEGLMKSLGYAKNKEPFAELAQRLPLSVLREFALQGDVLAIQALMLGTAGLLPGQRYKGREDNWGEMLMQIWNSFDIQETRNGFGWCFSRVRPGNFPTRRIIAASYLVARYGEGLLEGMLSLVSQASSSHTGRELERGLTVTARGYWANHFDFGVETRWSPSLIGRGRAREMVVNTLLPFSFAWAEATQQSWLEDGAMELYQNYPSLGENWMTRYMKKRIFGEYRAKLTNSACRQQGLIHLYKTFCLERRCQECPLGSAQFEVRHYI